MVGPQTVKAHQISPSLLNVWTPLMQMCQESGRKKPQDSNNRNNQRGETEEQRPAKP